MGRTCPICEGTIGQLGRCDGCDYTLGETTSRRSGGAGARTHPLSDEDYRRQMRKIERRAAEE